MRDSILGLINPLIALIFAGIFLAIWSKDRSRREIAAFSGAYALLGCGFLWSQFASLEGGRVYLNITNIPYFFGSWLMIWGAARRVGASVPVPLIITVGLTAFLLEAIATPLPDFTMGDLYIANTGYGILYMLGALAVAPSRKGSGINELVFWMLALTSVQFFVRPSLSFMMDVGLTHEGYRESVYYSVLNAVIALNSLALAVSLIAAALFDRFQQERDTASRDPLSGLLARREFERECKATFQRAAEENVPIGLVVGDIDHFKRVNDIWGHQAGDKAIAAFGSLIRREIREYDLAGRVGGEEFCIVVWNGDENVARSLAERLRIGLGSTEVQAIGADMRLTASFGAGGRGGSESYASLFARTDAALYRAKDSGRNRVVCASDAAQSSTDGSFFRRRDDDPVEALRA